MPKKFQASFTAGELDPKLHARVDLAKYGSGAARLLNMQVHPFGGASNRPGDEFVAACGDESRPVRLVEFQLSSTDTCVLEFGHMYMRVIRRGAIVLKPDGTGPYLISTPYPSERVFDLRFEQTNDVVKITALNIKPQNLSRFALNDWRFSDIVVTPTVPAPNPVQGVAVTRFVGTDEGYSVPQPDDYAVTSISAENGRESLQSNKITLTNDMNFRGQYNRILWGSVPGAASYNVYKSKQGYYGLIGSTRFDDPTLEGGIYYFDDKNYVADTSSGVPQQKNPFDGAGNYPISSSVFQQRAVYGGPSAKRNQVSLSQSSDFDNFNTSFPTKASDSITFALAGRKRQDVLFFVPVEDLVVFTISGEWRVRGNDSGVLTPSSIDARQQSSYGCADNIQPLIVQDDIIFVQAKGNTVRSIAYDFGSNKYKGVNLSLLSQHLFERRTVKQMAFAEKPFSTLYFVMSDGGMVAMTYLKDEQVVAWARHVTDGSYESVCCISEDQEDAPYFVTRRTVNGVQRRYIERRRSRDIRRAQDAFFVDSGLTYNGPETTTVSGLNHLEGRLVSGTVDGKIVRDLPVVAGRVNFPQGISGSLVSLGLPYVSEIETLDIDVGAASLNGELRNVTKVVLHVERSANVFYGQADRGEMFSHEPRADEGDVITDGLFTGSYEARYEGVWDAHGRVLLRMGLLPATVLAVIPEFKAGGDSGSG